MADANFWGVSGLRGDPLQTRDQQVETLIGDKFPGITKNTDIPNLSLSVGTAANQVPTAASPAGDFMSKYGMYLAGAAVLGVGFLLLRRR